MSVNQTFDDLYDIFNLPENWTMVDAPARVDKDPTPTLTDLDFPAVVLALDWQAENVFDFYADSGIRHVVNIAIYVFLGGVNTDLDELHQRTRDPWPMQIFTLLAAHLQLGGDVAYLGDGTEAPFLRYRVGYWPWGFGTEKYWGYKFTLTVSETSGVNYAA